LTAVVEGLPCDSILRAAKHTRSAIGLAPYKGSYSAATDYGRQAKDCGSSGLRWADRHLGLDAIHRLDSRTVAEVVVSVPVSASIDICKTPSTEPGQRAIAPLPEYPASMRRCFPR